MNKAEPLLPARTEHSAAEPVLEVLGVGEEFWAEETGEAVVSRERQDWEVTLPL